LGPGQHPAREHFFWVDKTLKMHLMMLPFRKWTAKSPFSLKSQTKKVLIILKLARVDQFCFQNGPQAKRVNFINILQAVFASIFFC
jgi:hypothetical protein